MKIVLNESFFAFCIRRRAIKSEFLPFTNRWSSVTVNNEQYQVHPFLHKKALDELVKVTMSVVSVHKKAKKDFVQHPVIVTRRLVNI